MAAAGQITEVTIMDWSEINCILEALDSLIEQKRTALLDSELSEDDRSDISNDLAYAEVLRGKYEDDRVRLGKS